MDPQQPNRWLSGSMGTLLTQGIQLALTVVILFFLGRWLDSRWGTAPWLMLAGIFLGTVGGLIKFIRTAMEAGREEDEKDKQAPPHP
ncbi:MAG TPA: AtpZ/AtpI family protein [Bacteroidota bacterium]|nr:AtpZ/AtpI family protein [Bacteroidota bacterium]